MKLEKYLFDQYKNIKYKNMKKCLYYIHPVFAFSL